MQKAEERQKFDFDLASWSVLCSDDEIFFSYQLYLRADSNTPRTALIFRLWVAIDYASRRGLRHNRPRHGLTGRG